MAGLKTLSRGEMAQIKRSRTKVGGKKIITDDIRKLKSFEEDTEIPEHERFNYYVEPITIEYYIPKESRFAYETKFLYIELDDPATHNQNQKMIHDHYKGKDEPIDIIELMNEFPQFTMPILDYYSGSMNMHETLSQQYKLGMGEKPEAIRAALYLNEAIGKSEPTIAALNVLGEYATYNINWCIRFLNKRNMKIYLEDKTVEYLIFRHRQKHNRENKPVPERFDVLTEIFMEQAFPFEFDDFDED